jgi:hypothetical protein
MIYCKQWLHIFLIALNDIVKPKPATLPYSNNFESNAKLPEQFNVKNAERLKLQEQLKTSQQAQEFYRQQALQADMVPPRRSCHLVLLDADIDLSPDQMYHQLLLASEDLQTRDSALEQLQLQHTQVKSSIEQLLTSSSCLACDLARTTLGPSR